jgi:two-component system cell cycle sensor histidine kinase/response regulator CckA
LTEVTLQQRVEALERKLSESEQTIRSLLSGEIDTIVQQDGSTPLVLAAAQAQLRANEQLFRAVFDGAMDAMLIVDDSGYYADANPAACALFGLPRERLLGRSIGHFGVPTFRNAENWAKFLRDGRMEGQFRLTRSDGSERDIDFRATSNILPGLNLSVLRDMTERITERKRVEDALRASDRRYRRIVDNTLEGVWMYDAEGKTTFMNPRMAEMLGCRVEEVLGMPIFSFMHESLRATARSRVSRRKLGVEERGDFRLTRRDGSDLWVSIHANPLLDETGKFESALALLTDITDRRRADETRNRLASIVSSSDDAIISRGVDGIIRTWNRGAEKLTQYSAAEAVGQPITILYPPEQASALNVMRARVDGGQRLQFEMACVRKDGSRVDVAMTASVLLDDAELIQGVSIIARDITERLRSEAALHRSEEQLRQAQKMEAIGSLAGGVAHDFNNMLSVILSYTSMIVDELKPTDPLRADIEEVHKAGMRATVLTRQLLAFSRHQMLQPIVLDLNRVVSQIETMLSRLLREDIQLILLPAPLAGNVYADLGQIEQVITNLLVNARDAMPNGGSLTLETALVELDERYAAEHVGVAMGPYVTLTVTDTGTGMDAATQERIFEPFFTTKDSSKGTGLGLSTVYGIIQQSGGHIHVASEVGKGTTFTIYLPRTDRTQESELPVSAPSATLRGTETILLVEDEEQVLNVMSSILRKHGYRVLEARNGGEAFLVCEQFSGVIDLLLTDVVMLRMSGRQIAERLLCLRPAMKVLYVSGYTDDAIVHHGVFAAGVAFLQKPVLPATLLEKVRQLLDSSPPHSLPPREASA